MNRLLRVIREYYLTSKQVKSKILEVKKSFAVRSPYRIQPTNEWNPFQSYTQNKKNIYIGRSLQNI